MGARKPKPSQLKERTSVRPQLGLSRLFAAANALVPFQKHEEEEAKYQTHLKIATHQQHTITNPDDERTLHLELARLQDAANDTVLKKPKKKQKIVDEESGYGTAVVVPNKTRQASTTDSHTATLKIETPTQAQAPIAATTSITKLQRLEKQKQEDSAKRFLFFGVVAAVILGGYTLLSTDFSLSANHERKSQLSQAQIDERLEYYRHVTGTKLNQDRINVQIQNFKQAPDLDALDRKVKPPNMMDGVPLQGERNNFDRSSTKDLPVDPTYSDARIAYGLQEEQHRQKTDVLARDAYVKDFIENARRDGIAIKIDEYGNVTAKKIPANQLGN